MKIRNIFFICLAVILIWFLFIERTILTPFILAAIFAYLLNPVVGFLQKKLHMPRILGVFVVYATLLLVLVIAGAVLATRASEESLDITQAVNLFFRNASRQVHFLPDWLQPSVKDFLTTFHRSRFIDLIKVSSVLPLFSGALSRIISFFVFLFSGFYFLKDGEWFIQRMLAWIPAGNKVDVEILLRKINAVLSGYLRGQIFLVFIVALALYIALSVIGVQFALTIAIFSGLAEIVPVIGPIIAGSVAVITLLLTGTANFGLSSFQAASIVIVLYFVLRYTEDYVIIPHVMHKITKLPSFLIFFAVIAGGHVAGVLGLILAVPIAAIIRLLLQFSLDKVHQK